MRIAWLRQVPYAGPAYFQPWAARAGHQLEEFLVPATGLPELGDHDRVIVTGGPMSIRDTRQHPWLLEEKRYLARAMDTGVPVLGICLGAQLMAEYLGAEVTPGPDKEIGWHPMALNPSVRRTWLADALPAEFCSFLWHGDFFSLPEGAVAVAGSPAHPVQGFVHGTSLALQFHLEVTRDWAGSLLERDASELVDGPFIQSAEDIASVPDTVYDDNHRLLGRVMDRWMARGGRTT